MNYVKYKNPRHSNNGNIVRWKSFTPSETHNYRKLLAKTPTVLKQIAMEYLDKQNNYEMYLARLKHDIVNQDPSVNRNIFWEIADMWSHHEMCQFIVREKIPVAADEVVIPLIFGYTRENQNTDVISSKFRNSIAMPRKPISETREAFRDGTRQTLPQSLPIIPPPPLIVTECDDIPAIINVVVENVLSELGHDPIKVKDNTTHSSTFKDITSTTESINIPSSIIPGTCFDNTDDIDTDKTNTNNTDTDTNTYTDTNTNTDTGTDKTNTNTDTDTDKTNTNTDTGTDKTNTNTDTGTDKTNTNTDTGTDKTNTDTDETRDFDAESWMVPNANLQDLEPVPTSKHNESLFEEPKSVSTAKELTPEPSQCQLM